MATRNELVIGLNSHALVVMAKAPVRGMVKSRLVPPLREDEAAELSRCFIHDVCTSIETAAAIVAAESGTHVKGIVAYAPLGMESAFKGLLPVSFKLIAQHGESLGERLINVADDLFAAGYESVSLMNSDSPTIPASILAGAITKLADAGDRVVISGAADGGYCLIGLKRRHWRIFQDISWSTSAVFAQTLARAAELHIEVTELPSWYDVDDGASLSLLIDELFGGPEYNEKPGATATATGEWLVRALSGGLADRLGSSGVKIPRQTS